MTQPITDGDPLAPAKGCLVAVALSLVLVGLIILMILA